jgi:hypothetical protein
VNIAQTITYSIVFKNQEILKPSQISMIVNNTVLGNAPDLIKSEKRLKDATLQPVVPLKNRVIIDK